MYYGQKANDVVLKEGYFISDGKLLKNRITIRLLLFENCEFE